MRITGEMMVFKNDIGYSTSISNKKEDGTYENMFIPVNFKKGVEIAPKTKINVLDGFLSFYKDKNNNNKIKLVIMKFESNEANTNNTTETDDLPF